MPSLPSYRSTLLGALLLLHCGGQSTDLFEDSPGGAGTSANAGRAGGSAAGATGAPRRAAPRRAAPRQAAPRRAAPRRAAPRRAARVAQAQRAAVRARAARGHPVAPEPGRRRGRDGRCRGACGVAGSDAAVGGTSGSGGGEGGLSGQGGTGTAGRGGDDCAALREELTSTLAEARACNLALSSRLSCTGEVVNECGCPVVVDWDDSVASRRYRMLMKQFNERCSIACPAIVCREPLSGRCETSGSGVMGTCELLLGSAR